jgi:membrane protein DedA with SNARE-associated domain
MLALPRPKTISDHNFLVPFPGYTLMFAVDIVTASGTVAGLPALMQLVGATVPAVAKLAGYWASAKAQHKAISSRLKQLAEIALSERDSARRGPYWRLSGSLETSFTKRDDLIYGIDDHVLFETMKQEV